MVVNTHCKKPEEGWISEPANNIKSFIKEEKAKAHEAGKQEAVEEERDKWSVSWDIEANDAFAININERLKDGTIKIHEIAQGANGGKIELQSLTKLKDK